jgi:hypothetical protein
MPDYEKLIERLQQHALMGTGYFAAGHREAMNLAAEAISTLLKERDDARRERDNAVANCVSAVKWLQDLGVDFSAATSA